MLAQLLDNVTRRVSTHIEEMAEACRQTNKESLAALQFEHGAKIERTRRGSNAMMQQQAVALEAAKNVALASQAEAMLASVSNSEDAKDMLLRDANEKILDNGTVRIPICG